MKDRPNKEDLLTADQVRLLIDYDPDTGAMTRKVESMGYRKGAKGGYKDVHGYARIEINGVTYRAHRVAWLHYYGEWPRGAIDHINGDRLDNSIKNLRVASPSVNSQNIGNRADNQTGYKGVRINGSGWSASIRVNNKRIHLGTYKTPEEAYAVYVAAKDELHPGCSNPLLDKLKSKAIAPLEQARRDEQLLSQALEALELSPCSSKYEQDCHVCNTISALRTRLSTGDKLSPTANLTKTS